MPISREEHDTAETKSAGVDATDRAPRSFEKQCELQTQLKLRLMEHRLLTDGLTRPVTGLLAIETTY